MSKHLIQVIDDYAETKGDQVAYAYDGEQYTYTELKAYSDALAEHIDAMNLPSDSQSLSLAVSPSQ